MKKDKQIVKMRIPARIQQQMLIDLQRKHPFAYERVGFLFTKSKKLTNKTMLVLATEYVPVADEDYVEDKTVGARINSTSIRKAMQTIFDNKGGCFHVHLHDHSGIPGPSSTDKKGLPGVAESFSNISGEQVNGILILSHDSFYCTVKIKEKKKFVLPASVSAVGYPMNQQFNNVRRIEKNDVFQRQSFLGKKSNHLFENVKVGIIGYGGGGSHIGQQLAHIGVRNIVVFDDDKIEGSNMNRLVGGWFRDIKKSLLKTAIAKRVIKKILPSAKPECINSRWQDNPDKLQECDVVLGCVDSYAERQQLEAECRHYLIPYIDIGMDVYEEEDKSYSMPGQVILSMPGQACMRCFGFLTDEKLGEEAARYGKVGGRPQVVWPNGVLASTAVGIFVDLVTGWSRQKDKTIYLTYEGNTGIIKDHVRARFAPEECEHYPFSEAGPPMYKKL
ncbi:MAG: ThiF family adenylyltransferase [Chitinophagaceae bacterium]